MATRNAKWLLISCLMLAAVSGCSPETTQITDQGPTTAATAASSATIIPSITSTSTPSPDVVPDESVANLTTTPYPSLTAEPSMVQSPVVTQTSISAIEPSTTTPALVTQEANIDMPESPPDPHQSSPAVQQWIGQAKEDLARRLELDEEQIEVASFELKVWSDAGLGCPQPGMAYIQVPQDGYLIVLRVNNQLYNYHGGRRGDNPPFLCQNLGKSKGSPITLPGIGDD